MTAAANGSIQDATVRAAMCGNREALHRLWQEHRRWIAAVILTYRPCADDLEDILQEVAMTMVAKISTIREESNVRAWLRAVAVNAARAASRTERARRIVQLGDAEPPLAYEQSDHPIEAGDHVQRVMQLAAQLPDAYREPLMLKALQGMRSRQIGEILGIPEATVDTRISRARRMLRELAQASDHHENQKIERPRSVAVSQD